MRRLSLITLVFIAAVVFAFQATDSPHGEDFGLECSLCHTSQSWELDRNHYAFDHNTTAFPLNGQHNTFECRKCHISLVFNEAETECIACHEDMHQENLGTDCGRCHTPQSWLVSNIGEIHQLSRFPLAGPHLAAACSDCHQSASSLLFEPLGVECVDCHEADYLSATNPNHVEGDFSRDCEECHKIYAFTWTGTGIDHSFFPLTAGHAIADCYECHTPGTEYSNISRECFSCHEGDYKNTTNPDHELVDLSTNCNECHTTNPGWRPASFQEHDALFFPIYSGEHNGEWEACTECHNDPGNYTQFTCIDCHEHNQAEMDDEHDDVGGYVYESIACFECHPTGSAEDVFDHNTSNFPLTGAHITTECMDCHTDGFAGTPMECYACHEPDYNESANPSHTELALAFTCEDCHTTEPEWKPAAFDVHDEYYAITGKHMEIFNECAECHNGDYVNTPATCVGCHQEDYNEAEDPDHQASQFPTTCEVCHTTEGWEPSTYDHNATAFPLTGAHMNTDCLSCHADGYTGTPTACFACHEEDFNESANPSHNELGLSTNCEDCHSTEPGWEPASFDVHDDYFALIGAHNVISNNCFECHEGEYNNTPNTCVGCHLDDYNQTTDPDHEAAQFSTDCELCHSQNAWEPATFDHDSQYFPIYSGEHQGEWDQCTDCHTNPTNYAIFSCIDCHEHNQPDMDDEHEGVSGYQYNSIACLDCHPNGGKMQMQRPKNPKIFKLD